MKRSKMKINSLIDCLIRSCVESLHNLVDGQESPSNSEILTPSEEVSSVLSLNLSAYLDIGRC